MESRAKAGGAHSWGLGVVVLWLEAVATLVLSLYLWQQQRIHADLACLLPAASLLAATLPLIWRRRAFVCSLLPIALALNLLGLVMLAVIAPSFCFLQSVWSILAVSLYLVLTMHMQSSAWLNTWHTRLYGLSLALVLLTFVIGTNPSGTGPKQWLAVGPFYFQPSELLKLALMILLAYQLGGQTQGKPGCSYWAPAIAISVALLAIQGDLGATFMLALTSALMIYAATGRWRLFATGLVLLLLAGMLAYRFVPHVRLRFGSWLNPWLEPFGASYQVVQGLRAIATGGIFGKGLLTGDSLHVPAAHTDMIITAIGERLGLGGSLATLALYLALLRHISTLGRNAASRPQALLSLGVAILLVGQAVVIIAGGTSMLPLTGVTLPLVSYGGSSLLVSYLALGVLEGMGTGQPTAEVATSAQSVRWQQAIYLILASALAVLAIWLLIWHVWGQAILLQQLGTS